MTQPGYLGRCIPGLQDSAILRAHARPKTTRSKSEFAPRRLAPCTEAQAASPQAYRPGTTWSWPSTCRRTCGGDIGGLSSAFCIGYFPTAGACWCPGRKRKWRPMFSVYREPQHICPVLGYPKPRSQIKLCSLYLRPAISTPCPLLLT